MSYPSDKGKLIVVGMRFQSAYYKGLVTEGNQLVLKHQPANATNGNAISVCTQGGTKIGYVRDQDLSVVRSLNGYSKNLTAKVRRVYQNYIIIDADYAVENADDTIARGVSTFGTYTTADNFAVNSIRVTDTNISASKLNLTNQNKEPQMGLNTSTLKDNFFREVKNVAIDIQTGKVGVVTKDGVSVYDGKGVAVNPITEMSVTIPAFAVRVPIAELEEGDILVGGAEPVFFKEVFIDTKSTETVGFKTVSASGVVQEVTNVTNLFFGKNSVLAVKNILGGSGMNPMMLMFMSDAFSGSGTNSGKKLDPMLLAMMMGGFGGSKGGMGEMNPLMLAMFLGKN